MRYKRFVISSAFCILTSAFINLSGCKVVKYYINPGMLPKSGTIELKGLSAEVEVRVDEYGIPHIKTASIEDAVRVIGYLQAGERLFQMDMARRSIQGRLAEILGKDLVDIDRTNRVLGFKRVSEAVEKTMDHESRKIIQAFADGVNEFAASHRKNPPLEFRLIDFEFEPWKVSDTISMALMMGYTLSGNWEHEILLYALSQEIGEEKARKILPLHSDPGPYIIPPEVKKYQKDSLLNLNNFTPFIKYSGLSQDFLTKLLSQHQKTRKVTGLFSLKPAASNSWVVAGKKTVSGAPILSNDPHLQHSTPSIWWEAHVKIGDMDITGAMFPGTPFVILGHTRHIAWGATTTCADTQDLYIEKLNPDNPDEVKYGDSYEPLQIVTEKILFKKEDGSMGNKEIKVRICPRHGPIINDIIPGGLLDEKTPPIALRWTGYDITGSELDTFTELMETKTWKGFLKAMKKLGVPVQNWIYADVDGNIGYIANGWIPIRKKGDGTMPMPGWDPEYDWNGLIPQHELPQVLNPSSGYIATANNKVVPFEDYKYMIGARYCPPYRAWRITELLEAKEKLTVDDMKRIQNDIKFKQAERITPYFINAVENELGSDSLAKDALTYLKEWDFETSVDSVASTIYHETYYTAFEMTLYDEVSGPIFENLRNDYYIRTEFDNWIEKDGGIFDIRKTESIETRDKLLAKSFKKALKSLRSRLGHDMAEWKWGELHQVLFDHPMGPEPSGRARKMFSVGPFAIGGSGGTVNNAGFSFWDEPYLVKGGPSLRHIVDMSDVENAQFVITVGQSGVKRSKHYKDQVDMWMKGEYRSGLMEFDNLKNFNTLKFKP